MQKEILTIEQCREELIRSYRPVTREILIFGGVAFFFTVIFDGMGILLNLAVKPLLVWWIVTMTIMSIPPLVMWIALFVSLAKGYKIVRKAQTHAMEMVEDVLESAYEDGETIGRHYNLFYVLNFRDHGRYRVSEGQHYGWSELYAMSDRGIYNTSISGDEFYILRWKDDRHHTPIYVFNKKLFEFCPDGTERKPRKSWRDSVSVE